MWRDLYESGAFESMEFRALGDVAIENLSESEKDVLCSNGERDGSPAGDFMMGGSRMMRRRMMMNEHSTQGDIDTRFFDGKICSDTGVVGQCDGVKSEFHLYRGESTSGVCELV